MLSHRTATRARRARFGAASGSRAKSRPNLEAVAPRPPPLALGCLTRRGNRSAVTCTASLRFSREREKLRQRVTFPPKRDSHNFDTSRASPLLAAAGALQRPLGRAGARPAQETSVMRDHSVDDPVLARLL